VTAAHLGKRTSDCQAISFRLAPCRQDLEFGRRLSGRFRSACAPGPAPVICMWVYLEGPCSRAISAGRQPVSAEQTLLVIFLLICSGRSFSG
jgi:hypothetical protein